MPVTDINAIRFCNEHVRVNADKLAQAYTAVNDARNRWDALGGGSGAISIMGSQIKSVADRLVSLYESCYRAEKIWFLLGATSLIPNTSDPIFDNSDRTAQDPSRPPMTGQSVVALVDRLVQFQNWLLSSTGDFSDPARNSASYYNTVLAGSNSGPLVLTVSNAENEMTRFSELRTRYQANTNQELGIILAVAVNPNL